MSTPEITKEEAEAALNWLEHKGDETALTLARAGAAVMFADEETVRLAVAQAMDAVPMVDASQTQIRFLHSHAVARAAIAAMKP